MNGTFFDNVVLKDIVRPVQNAHPHQKHTAFFEIQNEQGEMEALPPIPAGMIYTPVAPAVPDELSSQLAA